MTVDEMPELADIVAAGLHAPPERVAERTSALRRRFATVHFVRT